MSWLMLAMKRFCSVCECRGSVIGYAEFVNLEGEEGNLVCFS